VARRGLPAGVGLRHDAHYVEELTGRGAVPVGRLIAVERLYPNPEQPRVEMGDLDELVASVREKGVLEPLLVRPSAERPGYWMIIAGERRWRAARAAGLREVPCIELEVDDRAVAEIALIENLQRKDLTPWEEADGLSALCERFGYTHEEVARKVGKSRSTVTEALSIASLPPEIRERCRRADINSKSLLLEIVRQPDEEAMRRMVDEVVRRRLTRDEARAVRRAAGGTGKRAAPYVYRYANAECRVEVRFRRAQVAPAEVKRALEEALAQLASDNERGAR